MQLEHFIHGQPLEAWELVCEEMRMHVRSVQTWPGDRFWWPLPVSCCQSNTHPATGMRGW